MIHGDQSGALGDVLVASGATLGGSGIVGGLINVLPGGVVAPGSSVGGFTVGGGSLISGTLEVELDGASSDQLVVTGSADVDGLVIEFTELNAPTESSYTLISATTITGNLGTPVGLPTGYELNTTATEVTLDLSGGTTPFQDWISSNYPSLTGDDALAGSDPDGDGIDNEGEFAFDGDPTSASNNGKVFLVIADGDDSPDTDEELILTVAIRTGASFPPSGSPLTSNTIDGIVYNIEGSLDLSAFGTQVNLEGAAVGTGSLPAPSAGWEYRSFSLEGSDGLSGKGFLRARASALLP